MTGGSETPVSGKVIPEGADTIAPAKTYWQTVRERLGNDKMTVIVTIILVGIVCVAVFAPLITQHDPYTSTVTMRLKPIGTPGHWLGTDEVGRDMWARLAYGGRTSLLSGIAPVGFALVIGTILGVTAGFVGGWVGSLVMRIMDVFYAFPAILLAIAIGGVLGPSLENTIISLTIVFVPPITRISESVTAQVRHLDFVEAARASGAGTTVIIRRQVLSNVLGPILVYATSLISISIILAAGLSFLGLGVVAPIPEWGAMLNSLRNSIYISPWVAALPGLMIFMTSMCFNLMSDGFRSAMDIKL